MVIWWSDDVCRLGDQVGIMNIFVIEVYVFIKNFGMMCVFVGVDFVIYCGEFVVIMGVLGFGKMIFLYVLVGIIVLDVGSVVFCFVEGVVIEVIVFGEFV